jgi:hypothetical protein
MFGLTGLEFASDLKVIKHSSERFELAADDFGNFQESDIWRIAIVSIPH